MGLGDYVALLEHLPKVGMLLNKMMPLLEARFGGAQASAQANEELRSTIDALRAEVGKGSAAQATFTRQLHEQSEALTAAASDLRDARIAIGEFESRLVTLETQAKTQAMLMRYALALLTAVFLLLIWQMVHHR